MTKYDITKGIPMKTPENSKYPFDAMEVGDSFRVESDEYTKVVSASHMNGMRNNKKYSVRKHEGAYRCWRKS